MTSSLLYLLVSLALMTGIGGGLVFWLNHLRKRRRVDED